MLALDLRQLVDRVVELACSQEQQAVEQPGLDRLLGGLFDGFRAFEFDLVQIDARLFQREGQRPQQLRGLRRQPRGTGVGQDERGRLHTGQLRAGRAHRLFEKLEQLGRLDAAVAILVGLARIPLGENTQANSPCPLSLQTSPR